MIGRTIYTFFGLSAALGATLYLYARIHERSMDEAFTWDVPPHFPIPNVPADNPMSTAKIELGRRLFYDERLSLDGDMSCGSCHRRELAFTDGRAHAIGTTGQRHRRGSMSLANVAYAPRLTWANPLVKRLEHQALMPIFGEDPVEMGMSGREEELLRRLREDERYLALFAQAFPRSEDAISLDHVTQALAAFERTLISGDSPYDRYVNGAEEALSESAKRGMELFFSERLECFHCHGGFNFTDSADHQGMPVAEVAYHNTGLYNVDGQGAYPEGDTGVHELTGDPSAMGRFRAPTLRNVSVTAPYMHDGSLKTLEDVIDHYALGGRAIGGGQASPLRSEFVPGFVLTPTEKQDLIAFLESLTDETFLTNPRFADPNLANTPPALEPVDRAREE